VNCDIVVLTGASTDYTFTNVTTGAETGSVRVVDNRAGSPDGTDTLWNIERVQFGTAAGTPSVPVPGAGTGTAPTVTAQVPAAAATGVATGANITATFSAAVTGVNTTTFAVRPTSAPGSTPIAGTVTQNGTTNQWILNPTNNLAANTSYTVTLTGGATAIRTTAGNTPLATTSWTFTTAAAADTTAPTVTARVPAVNATGVAAANDITATFSEAVQGVSTTTFVIRPTATPGSTPIAGTVTAGTANQWILNPNANLANNTQYTVTLTGGTGAIRDAANNPLVTTSWNFTTSGADTTAPTITARAPAPLATGVSRTGNVTVTFSEAVQGVVPAGSTTSSTFLLRVVGTSTNITAAVTRNGTTNQWILDPTPTLAANTRYVVALAGGANTVRDLAGNPLVTTNWTFTTGP
jgi:hypothetical protein